MEPLVLSIQEAAEVLRISERLTYSLVQQGVVPSVKLGARTVIPVDCLKRMLEQRTEWNPDADPGIRFASAGEAV